MLPRILLGAGLLIASCSAPLPPPAPERSTDELDDAVRTMIGRVDANLFSDRDQAAKRMAGLGMAALPAMHRHRDSSSAAAREALDAAIRIIHSREPLFLVRPPERKITAQLKETTRAEAHRLLFREFPLHPPFRSHWDLSDPVPNATIWVTGFTYWQAVRTFCLAFDLDLEPDIVGTEFEPPTGCVQWSEPRGACIVSATRTTTNDGSKLTVRIHLEPGYQPINGALDSLRLFDSDGKELGDRAPVQYEPEGGSFMGFTGRRTLPTVGKAEITLDEASRKGRRLLSLTGRARVVLPTKVETAAWTSEDGDDESTRTVGGCRVEARDLGRVWSDGSFHLVNIGSGAEPETGARTFRNRAWIIVADDAGRSIHNGSFGLTGRGGGAMRAGGGWTHEGRPTKLCVIRPLEAEVVDFPFEIKGIPWPGE